MRGCIDSPGTHQSVTNDRCALGTVSTPEHVRSPGVTLAGQATCSVTKQPSFWIECIWPSAKGLGRPCAAWPFPPSFQLGEGTPSQRLTFPSQLPLRLYYQPVFISTTRLSARQFEQNLIWSVLTFLCHRWQGSGIGCALGQVVNKHICLTVAPPPIP